MDIQEDHTGGRRQISLGCGAGPSHHVLFRFVLQMFALELHASIGVLYSLFYSFPPFVFCS